MSEYVEYTCTWCEERIYLSVEYVWVHGQGGRTICSKHVGAAAFVRGVSFFATPSYVIEVPVMRDAHDARDAMHLRRVAHDA